MASTGPTPSDTASHRQQTPGHARRSSPDKRSDPTYPRITLERWIEAKTGEPDGRTLVGTNLTGANLGGVNLTEAQLEGADLTARSSWRHA